MTHPILKVLNGTPIDRKSRIVTSQARCVEAETSIDRDELALLVQRLDRKRRLLKYVLKIDNKRQHKNVIQRFNNGWHGRSSFRPPRIVAEYVRLGRSTEILNVRLHQLRTERKESEIHNNWTPEQRSSYSTLRRLEAA